MAKSSTPKMDTKGRLAEYARLMHQHGKNHAITQKFYSENAKGDSEFEELGELSHRLKGHPLLKENRKSE